MDVAVDERGSHRYRKARKRHGEREERAHTEEGYIRIGQGKRYVKEGIRSEQW